MIVPIIMALLMKCEKFLVAEDPWPFAEHPTEILLEHPGVPEIYKELEYRAKAGMMTKEELEKFATTTKPKGDNDATEITR